MIVLEDYNIFLIWAAWVLLNFYPKEKLRFTVWSFTEKASFFSFHGGIWSRYSEINTFKISKGLIFPEITTTYKKLQVSKAISSILLFALLDVHYNNSVNTEVQRQNET